MRGRVCVCMNDWGGEKRVGASKLWRREVYRCPYKSTGGRYTRGKIINYKKKYILVKVIWMKC